jgi:YD repeat-containing protein
MDVTVTISTESQGGDAGRLQAISDPRSILSKIEYDVAGRKVRTIDGVADFGPSVTDDRIAEYKYDGMDHFVELHYPARPKTRVGVGKAKLTVNGFLRTTRYFRRLHQIPTSGTPPARSKSHAPGSGTTRGIEAMPKGFKSVSTEPKRTGTRLEMS